MAASNRSDPVLGDLAGIVSDLEGFYIGGVRRRGALGSADRSHPPVVGRLRHRRHRYHRFFEGAVSLRVIHAPSISVHSATLEG